MSAKVKNDTMRDIIADLQNQLAEKDDIIRAIQSGEVDVLINTNAKNKFDIFHLQGAELTYHFLIESMNEGAVTLIDDGTIIYCNKKFSEFLKLSSDKIINTNILKYIQQCKRKNTLLKDFRKNNIKEIFTLKASDHSTKTVIFSCKTLPINHATAISIVVTDLSDIQEAEHRYTTLVENASCGIVVLDYEGVIIEANKQTESVLGCTKKQIISHNLYEFIPASEQQYIEAQMKKLSKTNSIGPNETHVLAFTGEVKDIIYTVTHIIFGEKKLLLGVFNDITEKNRLRTQALLNDKLASVGAIATGIVHEINNPLTWVNSNLCYLKEILQQSNITDITQEKEKLTLIQAIDESIQGTNQIKDIIQELKGFARINNETYEPIDINPILDSAIKMTSFQFKDRILIHGEFDKNIPLLVLNKNKLHQVVLNLIINAAQSMDTNKTNNSIVVKSYLNNHFACIEVTDTGQGIAPDIIQKIFEPFFTTKSEGVGTGLGLSLCYDIIKSLGGNIDVKSTPGIGSTFTVNLPLHLRSLQEIQNNKKSRENTPRYKILVINNDYYLSNKVNTSLKNHHDLTFMKYGRDALLALTKKSNEFDLIICDFEMPDINGEDIYQFTIDTHSNERFIFMSNDLNSKNISDFKNSNEHIHFIKNNFLSKQLLNLVEKMFVQ